MQEDFPATPSGLYGNRLLTEDVRFESDMQAAELKVVSITDDANSSFLPGNGLSSSTSILPNSNVDDQLEQAAKSLQNLYIGNPVSVLLYIILSWFLTVLIYFVGPFPWRGHSKQWKSTVESISCPITHKLVSIFHSRWYSRAKRFHSFNFVKCWWKQYSWWFSKFYCTNHCTIHQFSRFFDFVVWSE